MIKHATIKDLAQALGISKSTVSRALADHSDVKPETKRLVLEMAEKMNYRPNPYAQNLIRRRSKVIGVVVPEFVNSFFPRIIIQIQKVFEKEGFNVLITQSGESAEIELKNLHLLENSMVEGIILSVTEKDRNDEYYRRLIDNGIPIVFFNRPSNEVEASKVVIDDFRMAFFAVEHVLYANGTKRTRPLHLMGPKGIFNSATRHQGYKQALSKHGIAPAPDTFVQCRDISRECGFETMNAILDGDRIPDAVFCFNDQLAIGALKAIKKRGYRIPEQIAVMGFLLFNIFLGIIGTFWFRTEQRKGEMGLRTALGSTRFSLKGIMIAEGLLLLTLIAIPALLICFNLHVSELTKGFYMDYTIARFVAGFFITYLVMAVMIILGIWYPAHQMVRLEPADALRYE